MWTLTEYLSLKPFLHIWQWCINFDLFSNLWGDGDEIGDNLQNAIIMIIWFFLTKYAHCLPYAWGS